MNMEIDWSILVGSVIVVCATVGLVLSCLDAKDFITCVSLVLSFLSGKAVGTMERLMRRGRG